MMNCQVSGFCSEEARRVILRLFNDAGMAHEVTIETDAGIDYRIGYDGRAEPFYARSPTSHAVVNFPRLQLALVEEDGEVIGVAFLGKRRDR
jgi:hypothetical protein